MDREAVWSSPGMDRGAIWSAVQAIERRPPSNGERRGQERALRRLELDFLQSARMCRTKQLRREYEYN